MKALISRIARKILGRVPEDPIAEMVREGNVKIGQGCDLASMTIFIPGREAGTLNVEIGDNCCIRGNITIYRSSAKVTIGNNVYIGPGTVLECAEGIRIDNDVLVSTNCNIIDTNSHSLHSSERIHDTVDWQKGLAYKNWNVVVSEKIHIASRSWIGMRSIVMKGVCLAEGTIAASGSVVTKSTDPYTLIGGNPARFIKNVD